MDDPTRLDRVFADLPRTLTVREVAELLRTSERTVHRALGSGKLPGHKPLGEWVVFRDELRDCLQEMHDERERQRES